VAGNDVTTKLCAYAGCGEFCEGNPTVLPDDDDDDVGRRPETCVVKSGRFRFRSGDEQSTNALLMSDVPGSLCMFDALRPNDGEQSVPDTPSPSPSVLTTNLASRAATLSVTTTVIALSVPCAASVLPVGRKTPHAAASGGNAKSMTRPTNMSRAQDRLLTRVMVSIFVGYVLCFGLYFGVNCADPRAERFPFWAHKMAAWLVYLHCCANPVVYGLTNRQFWRDFVSLVVRCKARLCRL
jgi:hypothetical protein